MLKFARNMGAIRARRAVDRGADLYQVAPPALNCLHKICHASRYSVSNQRRLPSAGAVFTLPVLFMRAFSSLLSLPLIRHRLSPRFGSLVYIPVPFIIFTP